MTTTDPNPEPASVTQRLDELTDLFRRRLLDDRDKRQIIDQLQARLSTAERAVAADSLRPLVTRIALVIDRLETAAQQDHCGPDLAYSVADELVDLLQSLGVNPITATGPVDPRFHEVVIVGGSGPTLSIQSTVRTGYIKDGVVLRPAHVQATRDPADDPTHG